VGFFTAAALRQTVGGLCQTALGQSRAGAEVSQPLYPSRGDCQLSPGLRGGWCGAVSLHRLRRWRDRQSEGTQSGRVSAPLSPPCRAHRVRAHPPLWLTGQSHAADQAHPRPPALGARGRDSAPVSGDRAGHRARSATRCPHCAGSHWRRIARLLPQRGLPP